MRVVTHDALDRARTRVNSGTTTTYTYTYSGISEQLTPDGRGFHDHELRLDRIGRSHGPEGRICLPPPTTCWTPTLTSWVWSQLNQARLIGGSSL